jgi:hypothetical protein
MDYYKALCEEAGIGRNQCRIRALEKNLKIILFDMLALFVENNTKFLCGYEYPFSQYYLVTCRAILS